MIDAIGWAATAAFASSSSYLCRDPVALCRVQALALASSWKRGPRPSPAA